MQTLEEMRAHYRAVRERLGCVPNVVVPIVAKQKTTPPILVEEIKYVLPSFEEPAPVVKFVMQASPAEQILIKVAETHKVTVKDIKSHSHKMKFVYARQEAAYLMQRDLKLSLPMIGRVIGKRDHTTILHSIRQYKKRNNIEDNNAS